MSRKKDIAAAPAGSRRLFVANGGLLLDRRIRRILTLAGLPPSLGWPGPGDHVGVWGDSPTARRGRWLAGRTGGGLIRIEDAFLRSVLPGRAGDAPLGLTIDRTGLHFDPSSPSDIENILAGRPLDDSRLLARAAAGIAMLQRENLSKYNAFDLDVAAPSPGYVLVVDQVLNDASVRASGANSATFARMLAEARADWPDARILIRGHPETALGHRPGHFTAADGAIHDAAISPWALLAGARAVYAVSSQLGYEAILAGHRPVLFGQPFYAGWGLSEDRAGAPARRGRRLTREQIFAASHLLWPVWYDPCRDEITDFEGAARQIAAEARAWREDRKGWVATGMRLWKRAPLQAAFGRRRRVIFTDDPGRAAASAATDGRRLMVWAGKTTPELDAAGAARVEDGLIRSRGLGAELTPPLSLNLDDLGIYYDPTRESRLERQIAVACDLPAADRARAAALVAAILAAGLSKYNLGGAGLPPDLPAGRRILVPGQVEDDASIRLGAGDVRTNAGLLAAARTANPGAVILYKPHPDVEAGLRPGRVVNPLDHADLVLDRADPVAALAAVDAVWTMTSTLGFEALLRGVPVTCLGAPFYAGWGLTDDRGPVPARRAARPDIIALAHAALIAYPRYTDPVTRLPCPPETAVWRLAQGAAPPRGPANRLLAKAQGALAGFAPLWR